MAINLNHVREGSGEPLILIPGLGGTLAMWEPVMPLLTPHREVIAIDMPGFGRSPALGNGAEPSPRNLAAGVIEFFDSLGIGGDPHVCGQSLGAWVAIECGRAGRARSVVGLCAAGFWRGALAQRTSNPARDAARLFSPIAGLAMASESVRAKVLSSQIVHPERVSPRQGAALVRGYAQGNAYDEANALMRAGSVGDLSAIEAPITLAWGEKDRLVRRKPVSALPDSIRQVVIPDAGHIPTWDQPELVAELILTAAGDRFAAA